jgi:flagellar biosynthesis GTPase FlhF
MPNSFGKRGQASSSRVESKQSAFVPPVDTNAELLIPAGSSTGSLRTVVRMASGSVIVLLSIQALIPELTGLLYGGIAKSEFVVPAEQSVKVVENDEEDSSEILRQHLAERERMDREEEERERLRRAEDERWQQTEEARVRRQAEEDRHAELTEQQKRSAERMEELTREQMQQDERIAKEQARAEKQRRAAEERRHQEQLAQAKKSEKALRELNRPRAFPVPGQITIIPNRTERMMGGGPGLFERD